MLFTQRETHGNVDLARALNQAFAALGVPVTNGNIYFVVPAADPTYQQFEKSFNKTYLDGSKMLHTTVAAAYAATVSGRNDIIALAANAEHTLTAMLDVTKNRVNFVGLGALRRYGQGAKIALAVSTGATNVFTMKNTGVRNSFTNIKFINGCTVAQGIYCVGEGGEFTVYDHCEFYKSTDLDTESAEVVQNGDSAQFRDCTFGSLVDEVSDNIIRPGVLVTREIITGKVCRDSEFIRCLFWRKAGGTEASMVYGTGATAVERMLLFEDCYFINAKLSAATVAAAINLATALTEGQVLVTGSSTALNCTKLATQTGIFTSLQAIDDTPHTAVQAS